MPDSGKAGYPTGVFRTGLNPSTPRPNLEFSLPLSIQLLNQPIIPKLIVFFILITFLHDIVLIL